MINDKANTMYSMVPFVFQFAQIMDETDHQKMRYDAVRQISQILVAGNWVDGPDAQIESAAGTRLTDIDRETTDDE